MNLYAHQQKIIDDDPKKCGLFLGTGGGKTRTALSLAIGDTLIIMPKTQKLDGNWEREIGKIESKYLNQITSISKETFKKEHEKLPRHQTVIIDEAHTVLGVTPNIRYRNRKPIPRASQTFEAVWSYIQRTKPERLYLCTATPVRNPMTVWAAGILLGKKWDFLKWREMFYHKLPMPGREVWQPKKDKKSKELLVGYVKQIGYVGRLEDWFDVPAETNKDISCPLTAEQKKRIEELPLEYPEPLVLLGKTHQIEQGLLIPFDLNNHKMQAMSDLVEEFGKVLIFARYTDQIGAIRYFFEDRGKKVFTLTGLTKNRERILKEANDSEECIFIAQSQISSGYELPGFRCTIFASMSYSYVDYIQAKGRTQRANALAKNLYVHLITGEVDKAILKCMENHVDFNETLYAKGSLISNKIQ